ncbi:hypothetical protein [Rossellomorea marisflavi]|uniref:hypothetical protein n=1 Tax=Rossellomorea marisflavi TaxID=189381 RepID=UPI003F9F15CF
MKTWDDFKQLVIRYDEACWKLISEGGSRYTPEVETGSNFSEGKDWEEIWSIEFIDELFPFKVSGKTFEEVSDKAYSTLIQYTEQIESGNMTAHFLVGRKYHYLYKEKREVYPFSVDDCRKWRKWELGYEAFPTKEKAEEQLALESK